MYSHVKSGVKDRVPYTIQILMKQIFLLIFAVAISLALTQCNNMKPKKSLEDLRTAFNSETTFAEKYEKYAQAARNEGFDTLAQLFVAVSKSERIHASNHAKVIEKFGLESGNGVIGSFEVKSTSENLKEATSSESFDLQSVYQGYIKEAEIEKAPEIARTFTWARNSEIKHLKYFRLAISVISSGNETNLPYDWFICSNCGNMYTPADVKDKCEFCLTRQENFIGYIKPAE
jgi:rubrerythrin